MRIARMRFFRNIYWSFVFMGLVVYVWFLVSSALSEESWRFETSIFVKFFLGFILSVSGAVLLSRLSWAFESPAAHSNLSDLDRAAIRRRRIIVRIEIPLLAGGVMLATGGLFLFVLASIARFYGGPDITGFGVTEYALGAIGVFCSGSLLWFAGIGWGEEEVRRRDQPSD